MPLTQRLNLTREDWDATIGGWELQLLRIPGCVVDAVYLSGNRVDPKLYSLDLSLGYIRWGESEIPRSIAIAVQLPADLATKSQVDWWKGLAVILPFIASLLTVAATLYVNRKPATPEHKAALLDLRPRSKELDDQKDKLHAGMATNGEVFYIGATFYKTLLTDAPSIMKKNLARGVKYRFIIADPSTSTFAETARMFDQTQDNLRGEWRQTVEGYRRMEEFLKNTPAATGSVQIHIADTVFPSGQYFYDAAAGTGHFILVPRLYKTDAPEMPGFLFAQAKDSLLDVYYQAGNNLWANSKPIEEWLRAHPTFEPQKGP